MLDLKKRAQLHLYILDMTHMENMFFNSLHLTGLRGRFFTLILILSAILTLKEQVLEVKVKKIRAFPLKLDSLKRENVMDLVLVFVITCQTSQ